MKTDHKSLKDVDTLIKQGGAPEALRLLRSQDYESLKAEDLRRVEVAKLYRRLGKPLEGIKALWPLVEIHRNQLVDTSAITEYAGCLIELGSLEVAEKILKNTKTENDPMLHFYRAAISFRQWSYEDAIPALKKYIELVDDDYQAQIGKLNLAAALSVLRLYGEAEVLLDELEQQARRKSLNLLLASVLEIRGQRDFIEQRGDRGATLFLEAKELVTGEQSPLGMLLRKWLLLISYEKTKKHLSELVAFAKEARELSLFEIQRDVEFWIARLTSNSQLLNRVYLGTPFSSFRDRFRSDEIPKDLRYFTSKNTTLRLHSESGTFFKGESPLRPNESAARLLRLLSSDFYKPFGYGAIFEKLYPNEYFNPVTSRERVFCSVRRLRSWLKQKKIACEIVKDDKGFSLANDFSFEIDFRTFTTNVDIDSEYSYFKSQYSEDYFDSKDLSKALNITMRSAQRKLSLWKEKNLIQPSEKMINCYCFVSI